MNCSSSTVQEHTSHWENYMYVHYEYKPHWQQSANLLALSGKLLFIIALFQVFITIQFIYCIQYAKQRVWEILSTHMNDTQCLPTRERQREEERVLRPPKITHFA